MSTTENPNYYADAGYPSLADEGAEEDVGAFTEVFDREALLAEMDALGPLQRLVTSPDWPAFARWSEVVEQDAIRVLINTVNTDKARRMQERVRFAREVRDLPETINAKLVELRALLEEEGTDG